jgi:hypothetical protein
MAVLTRNVTSKSVLFICLLETFARREIIASSSTNSRKP